MTKVKILADSINPQGNRLITFECKFPMFIAKEILTHRVFSRNAASSRAIPFVKMQRLCIEDTAFPEYYAKNQSGMQAIEEIGDKTLAQIAWKELAEQSTLMAQRLNDLGLHKQLANRCMEPYQHAVYIISATEWHNFFALRAHPDAQQEFQVLAYNMLNLYLNHTPDQLNWGMWHIPFKDNIPLEFDLTQKEKIAVARCARISYLTHDSNKIEVEKDYELHDRLIKSGHFSPFEHIACARHVSAGNFKGWLQYRKMIPNENKDACGSKPDLEKIMTNKPSWVKLQKD
jgi:thymidylate synthase ThyX